jgi:hypothetical protein
MSKKPESLSPVIEEIKGEMIDRIVIVSDGISIYLKDGGCISFRAALAVNKFGITPILDRENGFWVRVEEE